MLIIRDEVNVAGNNMPKNLENWFYSIFQKIRVKMSKSLVYLLILVGNKRPYVVKQTCR